YAQAKTVLQPEAGKVEKVVGQVTLIMLDSSEYIACFEPQGPGQQLHVRLEPIPIRRCSTIATSMTTSVTSSKPTSPVRSARYRSQESQLARGKERIAGVDGRAHTDPRRHRLRERLELKCAKPQGWPHRQADETNTASFEAARATPHQAAGGAQEG